MTKSKLLDALKIKSSNLAQSNYIELLKRGRLIMLKKNNRSTKTHIFSFCIFAVLSFTFLSFSLVASSFSSNAFAQEPDTVSPDGVWEVLEDVDFPEGFIPPDNFVVSDLDIEKLKTILAEAPAEQLETSIPGVKIYIPRNDGSFSAVNVVNSPIMEPELANKFPEIKTYAFVGTGEEVFTGRFLVGPTGVFISAQTANGYFRVDPVETEEGLLYISFLDHERNDGANIFEHPDDERSDPTIPIPIPIAKSLTINDVLQLLAIEENGDSLRVFRLAAATTAEYYQARESGFGNIGVILALAIEVNNVNAVFEPELGVRLLLSAVTNIFLYSDEDTQPFIDNTTVDKVCDLRDQNAENFKKVLEDDGHDIYDKNDYDLAFLFATRAKDVGNGGCAYYNICLHGENFDSDDPENNFAIRYHKAAGAGRFGKTATVGSGTGLLLHEVGHQLGARHTYSGNAVGPDDSDGNPTAGCNAANFNPESAYAPGSGSSIMSYFGSCTTDDVELGNERGRQYYHTRSFEEIVDNITNGNGSNCGETITTGNQPPVVNAGQDYTIPQGTPFILAGTSNDDEPLLHNWEQFDVADTRRPIDTDDGKGPIIRSVKQRSDKTRTIPNLKDLIENVARKGEILPSTDRDLTFRFTARDGLGGVANDTMVVHVEGDPFFVTSPNGGETISAGCPVDTTWIIGGGDVADDVNILLSKDGGYNYSPLDNVTPNDGSEEVQMACDAMTEGRIKVEAADNIFFDISDENFTVVKNPPTVAMVNAMGGEVDNNCELTVNFSSTVTDDCGIDINDVEVKATPADNSFTVGTPVVNKVQDNDKKVTVSGSVLVSDLTKSPAKLFITVGAKDNCEAQDFNHVEVMIMDKIPPTISIDLDPKELWPANHKLRNISANIIVDDNCPLNEGAILESITSDEPDNGMGDGDTNFDIQNADFGTADTEFSLRAERAGNGDGRTYTVTYSVEDNSSNFVMDSQDVVVPKNQSN